MQLTTKASVGSGQTALWRNKCKDNQGGLKEDQVFLFFFVSSAPFQFCFKVCLYFVQAHQRDISFTTFWFVHFEAMSHNSQKLSISTLSETQIKDLSMTFPPPIPPRSPLRPTRPNPPPTPNGS